MQQPPVSYRAIAESRVQCPHPQSWAASSAVSHSLGPSSMYSHRGSSSI